MDLLTVVSHELGHMLELPDLDAREHPTALMSDRLRPGVRRVPAATGAAQTASADVLIPTLPAGKRVVIIYDATINAQLAPGTTRLDAQATIEASGIVATRSDDPDQPGNADPTMTLLAQANRVYLPSVHGKQPLYDLVVTSVTLTPAKTSFSAGESVIVTAVIKNQGSVPAVPFWVDLYANPARPPVFGMPWNTTCTLDPCFGLTWSVDQPLLPGQSVTLTSEPGQFAAQYSRWPGWLAAGTTDLYVLADSFDPANLVGPSGETNTSNNLYHIGGLSVSGSNPPVPPGQQAAQSPRPRP
jgi:hypothetical protein